MRINPPNRKKKWEEIITLKKTMKSHSEEMKALELLNEYKKLYPDHRIFTAYNADTFEPILIDTNL